MKKVVLIGPQASGKSTQAKVITDFLKVPVVSSSQVLRDVVAKGTELGKKIKSMMDQGVLVPDEYMINFFLEALGETRCLNGFLLDGFPRNINQAKALDSGCGVDKVFIIDISDEEAIRRIAGRRACKEGHVFHIEYNPSKKGDICDKCDNPLFQRDDDKEEIIAKRLAIYREETAKLRDYYKKQDKVVLFDGEQPIEKVSEDILEYLKKNVG